MPTDNQNRYAAPHVWNLAAKVLREHRPIEVDTNDEILQDQQVFEIALAFADRFERDEGFNRESFLALCNPVKWAERREHSNIHSNKQWERENDPGDIDP